MFENKKVQKTVQKPEVDEAEVNKAVRDFNAKNQNWHVLVFVSEDIALSPIASIILTLLTKMGDRPAIWIGESAISNEDKVVYLELVGKVAQELARLQKKRQK